ncbi:hypothetical protein BMR85_022055 [Achromobacter sp. KAs 3-5]|uniref:integrase core domain-containing protein n=1 Tax=Achromobacter mucicolens TaxID=1389922 RepID=UPI000B9222CD|nr:hypothetical protein BMR85_022055 [Achromobacter sp. KAs 3-5]
MGRCLGGKFEYIQLGKPQQDAYVERFNRTARYEWRSHHHWDGCESDLRGTDSSIWAQ